MKLSIGLLILAEMLVMSLWFVSAAILPEMQAEVALSTFRSAALSTAVQLGFVVGAVAMALHGTPDRFNPKQVFAVATLIAVIANLALLITPIGSASQILLRAITGAALAGVYPVGMKIAVGWTMKRRGLVVSLLVAALTFGSAAPFGFAFLGGADWRFTVTVSSGLALVGGLMVFGVRLGPYHSKATAFDPAAIKMAWTNRPIRLAFIGYLSHMWELYAFWAWIAAATSLSLSGFFGDEAINVARIVTFSAIVLGGLMCIPAGLLADKIGKAKVAGWFLTMGAMFAFASAFSFGTFPYLFIVFVVLWGMMVIPDSAQFSALVADFAPAERAGSLLTLQTAMGFLLTIFTVQFAPAAAQALGWPAILVLMGSGPLIGLVAMRRLARYA